MANPQCGRRLCGRHDCSTLIRATGAAHQQRPAWPETTVTASPRRLDDAIVGGRSTASTNSFDLTECACFGVQLGAQSSNQDSSYPGARQSSRCRIHALNRHRLRRTHSMHCRAVGSASSLASAIDFWQTSQIPYSPDRRRVVAASKSRNSASVSAIRDAILARSNAIVDPSGSCSSSSVVQREPSIMDSSPSRSDANRCSARRRSRPMVAWKSCIIVFNAARAPRTMRAIGWSESCVPSAYRSEIG